MAAYLLVGIDLEGKKESLGIWLGQSERVFATVIALFQVMYLAVAEAGMRWAMRTRNWSAIMTQALVFIQGRIKGYFC